MSRDYYIHDEQGERRVGERELPLRIGGKKHGGIVLSAAADQELSAYIALSEGHAYLQPAGNSADENQTPIFLNDERLNESAWLKSGDRIQIDNALLSWTVKGDKVLIEVIQHNGGPVLQPPVQAPPENQRPPVDELPISTHPVSIHGNRRIRGIAITLAGLLVLAAIYLLAATPVVIHLEPEADNLEMTGFPPPLHLWGSHLVLPGHYTIEASRPGYAPLSEQVDIGMDGATSLNYTLTELPGLLQITPTPEVPLQLMIDNSEPDFDQAGRAQISRGNHQISLKAERYLRHEQQIEIAGYGQIQLLEVKLQEAWANVSINSQPEAAEVHVDGRFVGQTPLATEILQGQHQITFTRAGYKPATVAQSIEAGKDIMLEPVQLQPVDGTLSITSNPGGASITLNGVFKGTTPVTLTLTANREHMLRMSKAGYKVVEQTTAVKPDQQRNLDVNLMAEFGTIFLTTQPADVLLEIDGRPSEKQNGRLRLSIQPHTFTVSKQGYATQEKVVTPRQNVSQNINIKLQPVSRQTIKEKVSATPDIITTTTGQTLQLVRPDSSLNMGASRREAGRRANENRRLVQFKRAFYFAQNETTNREYRLFRAPHDSGSFDGAGLNGESQPVVNVSWDDTARYCNWLSRQQGLPSAYVEQNGKMIASRPINTGYRLPSEAEWAWVARKLGRATEQRYPWEGTFPPTQTSGNYADARIADTLADVVPGYDDGYRGTAPVSSFPEKPAGFHDLGGNVSEWVNDYYAVYPGQAALSVTDPLGPDSATHHVVRGSGWRHGNITELRLSYRDYSNAPRYDLGFRIARYAE